MSAERDSVVLLHMDGSIITRDARQHMVPAFRCQTLTLTLTLALTLTLTLPLTRWTITS